MPDANRTSVVGGHPVGLVIESGAQTYYTYDSVDLVLPQVLIQVVADSVTSEVECPIWADNAAATRVNDLVIGDRIIAP